MDAGSGSGPRNASDSAAGVDGESVADVGKDTVDRVLAAWDAARALLLAARGFVVALAGLARSEWDMARASVPWVIALSIVLIGLALSLWLTLIALVAWVLYVATGSPGWALSGLVVLHVLGVLVAAWALKRSSRWLTMPATRAEVRSLLARARQRPEQSP